MNAEMPEPPGNVSHPGTDRRRLNTDRKRTEIAVRNKGNHLIQIGSHYHFFETNPALGFDRTAAFGMRLDLPAGDRIDFPAGETITVTLVPFGGDRRLRSFYGVVNGSIDDTDPRAALERLRNRVYEPIAPAPEGETNG